MASDKHRRSIRLRGFDYRQTGGYFITLCTHRRRCAFGKIEDGRMRLNRFGEIAHSCWTNIPAHFQGVGLDEFVVMPNHVHGILLLHVASERFDAPLEAHFAEPLARSVPTIVAAYKAAVTREIGYLRGRPTQVWQRNYYERIVRDETELDAIRLYILENSLHWPDDGNYME